LTTSRKVDFLIVGVQKAGTTALETYMREHADISMAQQKEVHFFDDEDQFNANVDYSNYHKNFPYFNSEQLLGEATPIYIYWSDSLRRIWEYNKQMKIIVILRNPITRAYSHWNMERDRGAESRTFCEAIMQEKERVREALPLQHRVYSYVDRGYYTEQLRRVYRFFSKEQVLVLKHEELEDNINTTLSKVSSFLGITSFKEEKYRAIHKREYKSSLNKKDFDYLKDIFFYEIKQLEKDLDWDCSKWLEWKC
jgi:hypothetical protein